MRTTPAGDCLSAAVGHAGSVFLIEFSVRAGALEPHQGAILEAGGGPLLQTIGMAVDPVKCVGGAPRYRQAPYETKHLLHLPPSQNTPRMTTSPLPNAAPKRQLYD